MGLLLQYLVLRPEGMCVVRVTTVWGVGKAVDRTPTNKYQRPVASRICIAARTLPQRC